MIIVALQLALAGVLAVAAVGKFLDLPGSRAAFRDFGLPQHLANPLGNALPAAELALAVLLLPGQTARLAALGAALLFLAFIAGIAFNLRQGRAPDCHCFGQFHSAPIGPQTLARNVLFTTMAAVIVWQGSVAPVEWFTGLNETSQVTLLIGIAVIALLAWQGSLLLRLTRQHAAPGNRVDTAPVSQQTVSEKVPDTEDRSLPLQAHAFDLPTLESARISLQELTARGLPVLLLFVSPRCGPCRSLARDIREWHRRFPQDLTIHLVSRGTAEDNREKFGELPVALQEGREVIDLYGVKGTPTAVLVNPDGTITEPYAEGSGDIRELVARLTRDGRAPHAPDVVDDASGPEPLLKVPAGPDLGTRGSRLPLPDLDGGYIGLDDLRGTRHVVLFMHPNCAFSQAMLPDLREWEAEAGEGIERLLIVSGGSEEANRALNLRSRLVIDNDFTTGTHYGATGTPSAIVIDEQGRVASPIATGSDAVLDLLDEEILGPVAMASAAGDD